MKTKFLLFLSVLILVSCAPGLGKTVGVSSIPSLELQSDRIAIIRGATVRIAEIEDARKETSMGTIDGRAIEAEGSPSAAVRLALESGLREGGVEVSLFSGKKISGVIERWNFVVTPGFPSTVVRANASIRLKALGPKDEQVFARTYSGESEVEHPFVDQGKVEAVLGEAMGLALSEGLRDKTLLEAIR